MFSLYFLIFLFIMTTITQFKNSTPSLAAKTLLFHSKVIGSIPVGRINKIDFKYRGGYSLSSKITDCDPVDTGANPVTYLLTTIKWVHI